MVLFICAGYLLDLLFSAGKLVKLQTIKISKLLSEMMFFVINNAFQDL